MSEAAQSTGTPGRANGAVQSTTEKAGFAGTLGDAGPSVRTDTRRDDNADIAGTVANSPETVGRAAAMAPGMEMSSVALTRGAQDLAREWATQVQAVFERNVETLTALTRARSFAEAAAIQDRFLRESIDSVLQGSRRMSELMMATTSEVMRNAASASRDS